MHKVGIRTSPWSPRNAHPSEWKRLEDGRSAPPPLPVMKPMPPPRARRTGLSSPSTARWPLLLSCCCLACRTGIPQRPPLEFTALLYGMILLRIPIQPFYHFQKLGNVLKCAYYSVRGERALSQRSCDDNTAGYTRSKKYIRSCLPSPASRDALLMLPAGAAAA